MLDRRGFLRAGLAGGAFLSLFPPHIAARGSSVALMADPADRVAASAPPQWALNELQRTLTDTGVAVRRIDTLRQADAADLCVVAAGADAPLVATAMKRIPIGAGPERLALTNARVGGRDVLLACGTDARGLTYALLELADRVRAVDSAADSLSQRSAVVERPANAVRSVMRQFTSEVLDKPWFNDREMWPPYLTMLATQRFNRFIWPSASATTSCGRSPTPTSCSPIRSCRRARLQRARHRTCRTRSATATSRCCASSASRRWRAASSSSLASGCTATSGPTARNAELHDRGPDARERTRAYCRDALRTLLQACPAISGVTFRVHGESGVAEGSYDFWKTVFDGVARCGRKVEIDMHAKGIDQR